MGYFEVSAKDDTNIEEVFLAMSYTILEKIENRKINPFREQGIKVGTLEVGLENPNTTVVLKDVNTTVELREAQFQYLSAKLDCCGRLGL